MATKRKSGKSAPPARRTAARDTEGDTTPRKTAPPGVAPKAKHPIDTAVDTFFENSARMRTAMSRNIKKRGAETLEIAGRAKAAFADFAPSKYSAEERGRRNFVSADGDTAPAQRAVVDKGIETIRATAPRRSMKLHVDGALEKMIDKGRGANSGTLALGDLMQYVSLRIGSGPLSAPNSAAFTACRAEREAQRRVDEILGSTDNEDPELDPPPGTVTEFKDIKASELVSAQVQTQMHTATSPEERVLFAVPSRASPRQTDKAIETFELRSGPADVTSYHDFNNLQIAFEHVWTEIFDGRLSKLGQDLYHEYVKLQEFIGVAPEDRSIDTIDDLKQLMDEIRELSKLTNEATPTPLQPPSESTGTTAPANTTDVIVDVVATALDPLSLVTDAIGDETVAAILNPAGAIIGAIADLIKGLPRLTWASFPGPLPGNADMISVRVEKNVVPAGTVEILLLTGPNTHGWKGIKFTELDANKRPMNPFWIANDPNDRGVWNTNSFDRLPLDTARAARGYLEFWHEGIASVHAACFVMDGLAEKLTDRTRVTFTWTKD